MYFLEPEVDGGIVKNGREEKLSKDRTEMLPMLELSRDESSDDEDGLVFEHHAS